MTTVEEKQIELDALQSAFDEYIVSSRELEEELDAELTKCQDDLAKAESRNTALASQLANIQPQLNSLESKLSTLNSQLSVESQRRISAEMKSEEAENKLRESEGALAAVRSSEMRKLKEENEDLCERLAFVEVEAEDYRNELETGREKHREEVEDLKGDVAVLKNRLKERENELDVLKDNREGKCLDSEVGVCIGLGLDGKDATAAVPPLAETEQSGATNEEREEYIRTLEDELELVTEQLIEAQTKLSQTQAELEEALAEAGQLADQTNAESPTCPNNQHLARITELEASVELLKVKNSSLQEESKRLNEELELALEELALSKEELEAYEQDRREQSEKNDLERRHHREEITALQAQLDKTSSEGRATALLCGKMEEALMASKKENQTLQQEVQHLEVALSNAKSNVDNFAKEMEDLKLAYDDAAKRDNVESEDQRKLLEGLVTARSKEVSELTEEVANLTDANSHLSGKLKDLEDNVKRQQSEIDIQEKYVASTSVSSQKLREAQNEIFALEGLLEQRQKELNGQRDEVHEVREELATAKEELKRTQAKVPSSMAFDACTNRTKALTRLTSSKELLQTVRNEAVTEGPHPESEFHRSHALSRCLYSHKSRSRPRSCSPTTIQRRESDAEQRAAAASSLQIECDRLENQNSKLQKKLPRANGIDLCSINEEKKDPGQDSMDADDVEDLLKMHDSEAIAKEVRLMAKKMSAQKTHNAELLTRILKLQGNIQVCCRIRPMSMEESQKYHDVAQSLSETEVGLFDERTGLWKSYAFDKVWGPETRQKHVFQDVEPMAMSVIDGYNACIFAYGQTGSGKTYTMEGNYDQQGISQRAIQKVFTLLKDKAQQHQMRNSEIQDDEEHPLPRFEYKIEVGMLEIYNDEVFDLLDPGFSSSTVHSFGATKKKSLDIRHSVDHAVDVPGLIKENVNSVAEVLNCLDRGNSNRAKAATELNEHSSRSHMILHVEVTSGVGEAQNRGILYLVDLAGSERVRKSEVEGKALKEARHINKSLAALGNVMEALDRKASHVPYRDSKLTYLLQNSLGGNSRTMMVVTICPHNDSYDETTFALKFATRVRRINLGSAQKNVTAKNLEEAVKNLKSEMSLLSKAKERSESQLIALKREKERVEEKLSKASLSRTNSKEEMRSLAVLRQTNNEITSRWQKEKIIREEKIAELGKVQEELVRVQRDLRNSNRERESLMQQNDDKENTIFQLKKDLRAAKDQLNEEKIRHRRSQVMQSRIPAPTKGKSIKTTSSRKQPPLQKPSGLMKHSTKTNGSVRKPDPNMSSTLSERKRTDRTGATDRKKKDPNSVARIRFRVLKMLQEHEPAKAEKIDAVMSKFEGRETELLEKIIARYEGGSKDESKPVSTMVNSPVEVETVSRSPLDDVRPKSRQDMALERHMARMKRIKASGSRS